MGHFFCSVCSLWLSQWFIVKSWQEKNAFTLKANEVFSYRFVISTSLYCLLYCSYTSIHNDSANHHRIIIHTLVCSYTFYSPTNPLSILPAVMRYVINISFIAQNHANKEAVSSHIYTHHYFQSVKWDFVFGYCPIRLPLSHCISHVVFSFLKFSYICVLTK